MVIINMGNASYYYYKIIHYNSYLFLWGTTKFNVTIHLRINYYVIIFCNYKTYLQDWNIECVKFNFDCRW